MIASKTDKSVTEAMEIHNDLLDRTRAAYMAGDFDAFHACFALPFSIETFEGQRFVETREQHRAVFDGVSAMLRDMGVIDMYRRTVEAAFIAPDKIDTTFLSQYILPGYKVSEEIVGNSILEWIDGAWKVRNSRYATKMNLVSRALIQR
jgi:hypothetical protein